MVRRFIASMRAGRSTRSEEHTSELQSLRHLVCRLLREKKIRQQHNLLRLLSRSEERLRRCERLQQAVRGQADRPPLQAPVQLALLRAALTSVCRAASNA